mgnify:CR=1 FL=1
MFLLFLVADTFEMQASALQVDGHVVLHGRPFKITNMTTSVEGKHGTSKVGLRNS